MTAVIDWDLAERVAARFSGREPFAASYHYDALAPDFAELTAIAEDRVATTTGLVSAAGPARARVVDRPAWIAANLASFQRLLRPLTDKLGERMGAGPLAAVAQEIAGDEVGAWLRTHYLGLVDEVVGAVDPDPKRFIAAIGRVADDLREGRNPLDDGGLASVLATPDQRLALDRVAGLMSLLEGHGDVTMDRAGADQIPSADRFGRVLRQRRQQTNGLARLLQRLMGLEAKLAQYEQGERFIEAIEAVGGPTALDTVWEDPARLPTLAEIRDPAGWLARIDLAAA